MQSSLSINEGSSPAQGFLYPTVFVQTVGYRVLILLINERVTAPRVNCFFYSFECVRVEQSYDIQSLPKGSICLHPWKWKRHNMCYYFVLKMSVLPLILERCPGKTVTSAWVGKVVAIERSINFSSCPHCPTCVTIMYKRWDISVKILISTPWLQSVQPTNVAPLSRMCIWYNDYGYYYCYYLRNILERVIVKGRKGLNSYHHNTILWPFPLKPYLGFLYRIMFWVFVAVCGTPFVPCSFSLFYSCIMFL